MEGGACLGGRLMGACVISAEVDTLGPLLCLPQFRHPPASTSPVLGLPSPCSPTLGLQGPWEVPVGVSLLSQPPRSGAWG